MDKNVEILLGNKKNINALNVDNFERVQLSFKPTPINEYDVRNVLSASEIFDIERNTTPVYRIYGSLEYLSLLNGLNVGYSELEDFFNPVTDTTTVKKDISNSFYFYLVKPNTGYTQIYMTGSTTSYTNYVINEPFFKWDTYTSENGIYPVGWEVTAASAFIGPEPRLDMTVWMKLTLNSWDLFGTPADGSIAVFKNIRNPFSGDFIIEVEIDGTDLNRNTDEFMLNLISDEGPTISLNLLAGSIGVKKYNVSIPVYNPITRVAFYARASDKTMYVNYLKIYEFSSSEESYSQDLYIRKFDIIATPNDIELFKIGYSTNIFAEQMYGFNFNKDINISNYFDDFGFPITELYLYAKYIPVSTSNGTEEYKYTSWNETGGTSLIDVGVQASTEVYGDLISYTKEQYLQEQIEPQIHYIHTPYVGRRSTVRKLVWKYNPFIPIRLQYLSNELSRANSGGTVYEQVSAIPDYATQIDNEGNYVWREILQQGYIDPLTGEGVDYPFVNKRRYIFTDIKLAIMPDAGVDGDNNTKSAFNELSFDTVLLNIKTFGDIDNIGKPCQ